MNGYTIGVAEGSVTSLKEFLRIIAPGAFEPPRSDSHAAEMLANYQKELAEFDALTPQQLQEQIDTSCVENERHRVERLQKAEEIRKRYETMIDRLEAWDVKGNQLLEDLRKGGIRELRRAIEWDGNPSKYDLEPAAKLTIAEWIDTERGWLLRMVANYQKEVEQRAAATIEQAIATRILQQLPET